MKYVLLLTTLMMAVQSIYGMQKDEDQKDTRYFNYLPPGASKQKGVRLSDTTYPKVLSAMPIVCTDVIAIRLNKDTGKLEYLMVKRINRPAKGFWWFPGGRMNACEETFDAAERKCLAEGGLVVASFADVGIYRTGFPDSEWLDPETREVLPTDSYNNVVIAFYDPETHETGRYEDGEEVQWVDFEIRPSSLPMPTEEERQGVDAAYLDQAHRDAHRILDSHIIGGRIEQLIEETLRARREHRQALSSSSNRQRARLRQSTAPSVNLQDQGDHFTQFSFEEDDELSGLSFAQNPPFAQNRAEDTPDETLQSPRLLPRPLSPLTLGARPHRSLGQSSAGVRSPRRSSEQVGNEQEREVQEVRIASNSSAATQTPGNDSPRNRLKIFEGYIDSAKRGN